MCEESRSICTIFAGRRLYLDLVSHCFSSADIAGEARGHAAREKRKGRERKRQRPLIPVTALPEFPNAGYRRRRLYTLWEKEKEVIMQSDRLLT